MWLSECSIVNTYVCRLFTNIIYYIIYCPSHRFSKKILFKFLLFNVERRWRDNIFVYCRIRSGKNVVNHVTRCAWKNINKYNIIDIHTSDAICYIIYSTRVAEYLLGTLLSVFGSHLYSKNFVTKILIVQPTRSSV